MAPALAADLAALALEEDLAPPPSDLDRWDDGLEEEEAFDEAPAAGGLGGGEGEAGFDLAAARTKALILEGMTEAPTF
jgi:hypothetical protein